MSAYYILRTFAKKLRINKDYGQEKAIPSSLCDSRIEPLLDYHHIHHHRDNLMAWKLKYRCNACGYEAEVYEGRGLFRQQITAMLCPDCKTVQNIVVGGIIADVAPSFRSEVGRLCLQCGSDNIRIWDMKTCPKCQGTMTATEEKEFWT